MYLLNYYHAFKNAQTLCPSIKLYLTKYKKTILFYGPTKQNETAVQGLQLGIGSAATCASFYCYYNIIVILVTHV